MFLDITTIDGTRFGLQSSLSAEQFNAFLGRLSPEVPGPFDEAVVDAPKLQVTLLNTDRVKPVVGRIEFGVAEMTVLITHIRQANPAEFNDAGRTAINAKFMLQNFIEQ